MLMDAAGQHVTIDVDAVPTIEGYYQALVPIGQAQYTAGIQLGRIAEWVQIEEASFHQIDEFLDAKAEEVSIPAQVIADGMEDMGSGLMHCTSGEAAFLLVPPPAVVPTGEALLLSIVFRPVIKRQDKTEQAHTRRGLRLPPPIHFHRSPAQAGVQAAADQCPRERAFGARRRDWARPSPRNSVSCPKACSHTQVQGDDEGRDGLGKQPRTHGVASMLKQLTPDIYVAPQIGVETVDEAKRLGVTLIVNNRPEGETPDQTPGDAIETAARAAGLAYVAIPVSPGGFAPCAARRA